MIIVQRFIIGKEEECWDTFMQSLVKTLGLEEDLAEALDVVRRGTTYEEFFTLQFDSDKMSVTVVESV